MSAIRVAVTGAGSIVGQGIIKALRHSGLPLSIIATDIAPLNVALFRADEAYIFPRVELPNALEGTIECLRRIAADVLMIGSEFDLLFFARNRAVIERETGTIVIVSPSETVELADDKLRTAEFLQSHSLPYAPAVAVESIDQACDWACSNGYPLMLKTRRGTSGRHVHVIGEECQLRYLLPTVPNPMLQKMAGPISAELTNEYTCSIFQCADGVVHGPFVSRRTLRDGSSRVVEVAPESAAEALMLRMAQVTSNVGSLNVQLMVVNGNAIPFELNARFSGTTPIRAYFGFNEPEMALKSYLLGEKVPVPQIRRGVCLRYFEEVFLDDVSAGEVKPPFPRGRVLNWF